MLNEDFEAYDLDYEDFMDEFESDINDEYDNEDFEYDQYVENKLIEEYSKNLEKFD